MRKRLKKLGSKQRYQFTGIFKRTGYLNSFGHEKSTILLIHINDSNGRLVTNHIWFNYTKGFEKLGRLKAGDKISFMARVSSYVKGYQGYDIEKQMDHPIRQDYKLNYPTKIKLLNRSVDNSAIDVSHKHIRKVLDGKVN